MLNKGSLMEYKFTAKPWKYPEHGAWHFVSLPVHISEEIRAMRKWDEEGWGRLKVLAKAGNSEWQTAIWFDTKHETYLLPLKAVIRKKEKIELEQDVMIGIWL